jgi:RNA polymerase sigma-70 factor (ECF subfamily)
VGRRRAEQEEELEALFRSEYAPLVRAMTVLCGDRHSAADAVQDAFLQAHRHWAKVRQLERPGAWVRRAAIHRAKNQLRGQARRLAALPRLAESTSTSDADRSWRPDLLTALDKLPHQQRQAVVLYYLLDQPTGEVATVLGVSEATVRSHLRHARDHLHDHLEEGAS